MKIKSAVIFLVVVLSAASYVGAEGSSLGKAYNLDRMQEWKAAVELCIQKEAYDQAVETLRAYKRLAVEADDFDQAWLKNVLVKMKKQLERHIATAQAKINGGDWSAYEALIYYQNLCLAVGELSPLTAKAEARSMSP